MPNLNDPAVLALMIPIFALLIPVVAIVMAPIKQAQKLKVQRDSAKMYERLAKEKLDILKTAITMGYKGDDLEDLDRRLERLVGADKLANLMTGKPLPPAVKVDAVEADLELEMERIRQSHRIVN